MLKGNEKKSQERILFEDVEKFFNEICSRGKKLEKKFDNMCSETYKIWTDYISVIFSTFLTDSVEVIQEFVSTHKKANEKKQKNIQNHLELIFNHKSECLKTWYVKKSSYDNDQIIISHLVNQRNLEHEILVKGLNNLNDHVANVDNIKTRILTKLKKIKDQAN